MSASDHDESASCGKVPVEISAGEEKEQEEQEKQEKGIRVGENAWHQIYLLWTSGYEPPSQVGLKKVSSL